MSGKDERAKLPQTSFRNRAPDRSRHQITAGQRRPRSRRRAFNPALRRTAMPPHGQYLLMHGYIAWLVLRHRAAHSMRQHALMGEMNAGRSPFAVGQ